LRRLGQDVLTAFEDGRANQSISDPIFSQEQLNLTGP